MRAPAITALAAILIASVSACQPAGEGGPAPGATPGATGADSAPFAAITPDETIRLLGNEPFWGGTIQGGELVYSTPENQAGDTIAVRRFAGNNGLGYSGAWNGAPLDLTITPGSCSDTMSDRTYPFTVTLRLGGEQRSGCAWTDRTPFTGPEHP